MKVHLSKFEKIIVGFSGCFLILAFGFQNCSKMTNFAPTPEYQASTDGTIVDPNANPLPKTCSLDGVNYNENDSVERYQFASVASSANCTKQTRQCHSGIFDGTFTFLTCTKDAAPNVPQFSLSHVSGERKFTISTQFLAVTDSKCKVQYFKQNAVWTTLTLDAVGTPTEFDCNADVSNLKIQLPAIDGWNDSFSNVKVRLVKSNDDSLVGAFPQELSCGQRAFSLTPTPDIDENCNLKWDDKEQGAKLGKLEIGNKSFGAPYSCPATAIFEGKEGTFNDVAYMVYTDLYMDSTCTTVHTPGVLSYGPGALSTMSGNLGSAADYPYGVGCTKHNKNLPDSQTGNWLKIPTGTFTHANCEYLYDKKDLYY